MTYEIVSTELPLACLFVCICLLLYLSLRISADQDSWLPEGRLVLIGKSTRAESTSNGLRSGVETELEDGTLTLGFTRDNHNVLWVLNGGNSTGSHHDLFPGLSQVENVVLGSRSRVDVMHHTMISIGITEVDTSSDHLTDVLLSWSQNLHSG